MAQKVPPEEKENPRVKCKDCGAFGHTLRSRRCPIKCAYGFLVPQAQEGRKEKENQDPGRPQTQETLCQAERDKRPSSAQRCDEQQKKAPFPKLPLESPRRNQHIQFAQPKMPGSVAGNRKMALQDGLETTDPPVKKSLERQMCPGNPPTKNFAGSCILPSREEEGQAIPGFLKPAFKQDGRKAVSEDPGNQKLPGMSEHHPRDVPKRNGFGQVFNMDPELTNQGSPAELPWSQPDHVLSPRSHRLPVLQANP
ncbi:Putative protein FAM90A-like [Cricetulus griseus]|uniref:Zinc knuckle domain-containing protein n=1 Tax=Cricetulus griseus TaxID=10029 RepID=G3HM26_CRIGR|nr:Putative protein FAM90A-like [Cricetulus griseus]